MKRFIRKFTKQFRYGETGFTLIELLVVIAILGILAAVIVPNVSRFMGKGRHEAALTELHNVQTAVTAMMADQNPPLAILTPTNDHTGPATNAMTAFPDSNYVLFSSTNITARYIQKDTTSYFYTCDSTGNVRGWSDAGKGDEIGVADTGKANEL